MRYRRLPDHCTEKGCTEPVEFEVAFDDYHTDGPGTERRIVVTTYLCREHAEDARDDSDFLGMTGA